MLIPSQILAAKRPPRVHQKDDDHAKWLLQLSWHEALDRRQENRWKEGKEKDASTRHRMLHLWMDNGT